MLRKLKVIKGDLVLSRVVASQDLSLGGNRFCCGCRYLNDENECCNLYSLDNNTIQNRDAYDFCTLITPSPTSLLLSQIYRKFVYIYVEEKEIL